MFEIEVTHLASDPDLWCYSGSQAEHGHDAARSTWQAACEQGEEHPLLLNDAEREEARSYFASFGAWNADEVAAWTTRDLNGLAVQEAASALREREHFESVEEWQEACHEGTCSGSVYPDDTETHWFLLLSN